MEEVITTYEVDLPNAASQTDRTNEPKTPIQQLISKHISIQSNSSSLESELQRFGQLNGNGDENVLDFWKKNEFSFPMMANIAKIVLSIPLTTSKSESAFSISGCLMQSRRASIEPFRAEKVLFVHDNYVQFNL